MWISAQSCRPLISFVTGRTIDFSAQSIYDGQVMIRIHCDFQSLILATRVSVEVFLPNVISFTDEVSDYKAHYSFAPFKTLYLLHGAWDSGPQWIENTSVMRMAEEQQIALVLPSVGNSFYANTQTGIRYEDFFMEEVLGFVRALFPLSEKREENFIAGVSMGGYGALKTSFLKPELFSKCFVMSSVVDISYSTRIIRALGVETDHALGTWRELKGSAYDLKTILGKYEGHYEALPELFIIESTEDYLTESNRAFHAYLEEEGIPHTYREYPGIHEWKFWDEHLAECMEFLKEQP